MASELEKQIQKRRTFAIISHPDAGKTTLTEKFLLYGGAIATAGMVKGKKSMKHAVSDWMEIEKQRGISVTSSVLQFEYNGCCINILDTPGHQDFSEDTYRTLMAADSAVMVIDGSKGVERQTIKLFKVCMMRHIPVFTFVNKMDRDARNPFDLLEEIEQVLGIQTYAVNWPIGSGRDFKGVFQRDTRQILEFTAADNGRHELVAEVATLDEGERLDALLGAAAMGDIGRLFPDSDDRYLGADSMELLREVQRRLTAAGYRLGNLDATILAQRPKLAPYIDTMRQKLADECDVGVAACHLDPLARTTKLQFGADGVGRQQENEDHQHTWNHGGAEVNVIVDPWIVDHVKVNGDGLQEGTYLVFGLSDGR